MIFLTFLHGKKFELFSFVPLSHPAFMSISWTRAWGPSSPYYPNSDARLHKAINSFTAHYRTDMPSIPFHPHKTPAKGTHNAEWKVQDLSLSPWALRACKYPCGLIILLVRIRSLLAYERKMRAPWKEKTEASGPDPGIHWSWGQSFPLTCLLPLWQVGLFHLVGNGTTHSPRFLAVWFQNSPPVNVKIGEGFPDCMVRSPCHSLPLHWSQFKFLNLCDYLNVSISEEWG